MTTNVNCGEKVHSDADWTTITKEEVLADSKEEIYGGIDMAAGNIETQVQAFIKRNLISAIGSAFGVLERAGIISPGQRDQPVSQSCVKCVDATALAGATTTGLIAREQLRVCLGSSIDYGFSIRDYAISFMGRS